LGSTFESRLLAEAAELVSLDALRTACGHCFAVHGLVDDPIMKR
jgi:hypothetical protein